MRGSVKVVRLSGIDIQIHFSWFLIFAAVTWSLATFYFPLRSHTLAAGPQWAAGSTASVLFFLSVLAHELSHAAVAKRLGYEVEGITLFILGGMASISREAERAREEFWIAVAGPLSSLALGLLFGAFWVATRNAGATFSSTGSIALWLAEMNVLLALFNLVPGYPMDGGRVLRAVVWGVSGNGWLATRVAAWVGRLFAYTLVLGGVYFLVQGAIASAVWLIAVGWFLHSTASSSYRQAAVRERLKGVAVGQAMSREYPTIAPSLTLRDAFDRILQPYHLAAVPVVTDDNSLVGVLTRSSLSAIPEMDWAVTPAARAMSQPGALETVAPEEPLGELVENLDNRKIEALPVVDGGRLVGMLTRKGVRDVLRRPIVAPTKTESS
ncbi:MAG: site-2 protease family protein [Chloroflexi bacterium]|nr:site-2 protease family protein [Chloroflexota bacterium]MCL5110176.1 site-2 protease family protein [Chloroflexota bacterium]